MRNYLQLHIISLLIAVLFGSFAFGQGNGKGEYIVGTGNFAATDVPVYPWYGYSYTQTIYLQSELDFVNQMIQQIGYQYAGTSANLELEVEVWLEHTSQSTITSTVQLNNSTKVYDGPWNLSAGEDWSMITIDPFVYNNSDNLLLTIIEKKPGWNSSSDKFYAESIFGLDLCIGNQNDGAPYDPNALPASSTRFDRANTKFVTSDVPTGPAVSEITPLSLDFGTLELGKNSVLTVQLKNTGADPLEITGVNSTDDQFQVINASFPITLYAAGTQEVEIQFSPAAIGQASGTITFLMDEAIEGDKEVQVLGDCVFVETLIIGTSTETNFNTPIYPYYGYSFTQTIYFQSEIDPQNPAMSKIGYQYTSTNISLDVEIEVYLGHTTLTEITSTVPITESTKVYDGPWTCLSADDWTDIEIDPFIYNNTDNLLVTIIEKKPGWNSYNDAFFSTPVPAGQSLCVGAWNDGSPYDPNALPPVSVVGYRANIRLGFEGIPSSPAISEITPSSLDFGDVVVDYTSVMNLKVKNAGSEPLEVTGANLSNDAFSLLNTTFPFTLTAFQEKNIEVQFSPTTITTETGTITFEIDPSIEGDREVEVSGTGVPLEFIQVGSGTISSTYLPICAWFNYSFSQTLYLQSELNFSNLAITQLGYQYSRSNGSADMVIEVWMHHTQDEQIVSTLPLTGATKVYDGPWHLSSDDDISFIPITPFAYNNTDNLVVTVIEKDPGDGSVFDQFLNTDFPAGVQLSVNAFNSSAPYDPENLPAGSNYGTRANTIFWLGEAPSGPPVSQITPTTLDFGELEFGENATLTVDIKNVGIDPLEITGFSTTNDQFQVVNTSFPIFLVANQEQTVEIQFMPTTTELESGTITFEMDATIEGDKEVAVSGQMLPIPPLVITDFPWFEGFDSGALPDGWQNIINAGEGWNFFTNPFSHTVTYYFGDLERNSMLVTPLLDLSGLEHATFGINHRIYSYGTGFTNQILISEDGTNWDVLAEFNEGFVPDDYQYMEFDITPSKSGEQVYLGFAVDYPMLPEYYEVVWEIEHVTVFEPIPVYNVNFVVVDDDSNPLNDAVVTLDGTTNAAGDYLFEEIEAGTYSYSVELDGYITATGEVEVVDQDIEETVVLSEPVIITEFPWFEGFDGGALPEGWRNVVSQGNGWNFALAPYSHTYIYAFGDGAKNAMLITPLLDLSGLSAATLEIYHRIYAYGSGWSHKIMMSPDGDNWETIAEFTEGFNPDINMYMEFEIPQQAKSYGQVYLAFAIDYPDLPDYYEVVWEIVDIEVFEPISYYDVNFVIEDESSNQLTDAIITLNGVANVAGDYLFEDLEAGTYDYTVELDGYVSVEGQVEIVDQDFEETVTMYQGQNLELVEGWSLISTFVNPNTPSFYQIFSNQVEDESMVILIGNGGIFWPGYNINTLENWNTHQGYKLKMSVHDFAGIAGTMVEDKEVQLPGGFSYLPVLSDVPVSAVEILNPLGENLNFAFDLVDGLIYWPDGGIYSLEMLIPGRAYSISLSEPATVSFAGADGISKNQPASAQELPQYIPSFVKTGATHIISITNDAIADILHKGDVIAAFNSYDQCFGAVQYFGGTENLGLIIYGDDLTTDELDGLAAGDEIVLRLIEASTQQMIDVDPDWNLSMPDKGYFVENGLSAVASFKLSQLGISDQQYVSVNFYPNPARDILNFNLQGSASARVVIMDNLGREVWENEISRNHTSFDISGLMQGLYYVKVISEDKTLSTSKLIVK